MGVDPPFIYDRPSQYSFNGPTDKSFNPRAATHASWTPSAPKPTKDGPLIEFNKHPDSYLIVPYGNTNAKPMPANTKKKVKRLRQVQLFLRALQLLGALGLLFCVIAINKTSGSTGWIIRVAPAVAVLHTVYAVYHLCRSPTGRTAGSTSSYMVFAAMSDAGLLPFLAFSALMAREDYTSNAYGWSTLFGTDAISYKIIYAFFLASVAEASVMLISLGLGVYLAILFRKIAKLPPDMNPLEPSNLTARPHKRNKSELPTSEKHQSGSTVGSTTDLLSRRVPFMHTRTDSADSLEMYKAGSPRHSRLNLDEKPRGISPTRPESAIRTNSRQAGAGLEHSPVRSSMYSAPSEARHSWLSFANYEGDPTPMSEEASFQLDQEVRPPSPVSPIQSRTNSRQSDRIEIKDQGMYDQIQEYRRRSEQSPDRSSQLYAYSNHSRASLQPPSQESSPKKRSRDPLGMNPPSPLREQYQDENFGQQQEQYFTYQGHSSRTALQDTTANRPAPSSRTSSFVGSGGKTRFYGNLRGSIGDKNSSENIEVYSTHSNSDYERSQTMESKSDYSNVEIHTFDDEPTPESQEYDPFNAHVIDVPSSEQWQASGRHFSNSTGYDLNSGYAGLGAEFGKGMARRREVSGKIAEEGRSEYGSTNTSPQKGGAAGWARFKGL